MEIIELQKDQNLDELLAKHNKVILDFFTSWCGPCKMLTPQLENFCKAHNDWQVIRIDAELREDIAKKVNLQTVPTMVFIVAGQTKESVIGFRPTAEIEKITSKY